MSIETKALTVIDKPTPSMRKISSKELWYRCWALAMGHTIKLTQREELRVLEIPKYKLFMCVKYRIEENKEFMSLDIMSDMLSYNLHLSEIEVGSNAAYFYSSPIVDLIFKLFNLLREKIRRIRMLEKHLSREVTLFNKQIKGTA